MPSGPISCARRYLVYDELVVTLADRGEGASFLSHIRLSDQKMFSCPATVVY